MNQTNSTTTRAITTTASLSIVSSLTWQDYVRLAISSVGLITNGINISVFLNPKLKETSYRFMLAKSVANFLYLAISFANEFLVYCSTCEISSTYFANLYAITMYVYSIGTLSIYRAFIENMILLHTYCILTNKNWTKKIPSWLIILGLTVIACAYNIPKLFNYSINQIPGQDVWYVSMTSFGISATNKTLTIAQTIFKIFLTSVTLPLINILNMIMFRRRFKNRIFTSNSSNNLSKKSNYT